MNTIKHTQIIWISNEVPNLQNNLDEVTWCKTIDDAKHTIQEYEIETINSNFVKNIETFIKPIEKLVVEDSETYGHINLWLSETNRQYLMDKVELIPREVLSGNIKVELTKYIITRIIDGRLTYFSRKEDNVDASYWSDDMKHAIMYNLKNDAEEQITKHYAKNSNWDIRKIKINAMIDYIY